jgi:D-alanyl-D-alanine carboxypeptidase
MGTRTKMALVVAAIGLTVSACLPPPPPSLPENGRLPDRILTTISSSCRVLNDHATPLRAMLEDARSHGIQLRPETRSYTIPGIEPPRIESCYRSYEMQVWWRDYYCFFGQCGYAAVPGTSIHGWGKAIDFEDQHGFLTFTSPGFVYLAWNAWRYGFHHPAWAAEGLPNAEAWHWEAD